MRRKADSVFAPAVGAPSAAGFDRGGRCGGAGMAYMGVLLVVLLVASMGTAFVLRTGTQAAASYARSNDMQAHYLAETGANHALWRILNEPGFPASLTDYYMHSLGGGRYGYKVRPPTGTTFATVATVGAAGNAVVHQSYVQYILGRAVTVYGESGVTTPRYRRLVAANWGSESGTFNLGNDEVRWVEMAGCPTRNEVLAATLDGNDNVTLMVWNGSRWSRSYLFAQSAKKEHQCLAVAYESQSGDALVLAYDGTQGEVIYRGWNGSAFTYTSSEVAFRVSPAEEMRYIRAAANPNSDEILIAVLGKDKNVFVYRWTGSLFECLGPSTAGVGEPVETDAPVDDLRTLDVAYEQQSGVGMIVYGENGSSSCRYRTWDAAAPPLSTERSLPSFGHEPRIIRLVADPASDKILAVCVDEDKELEIAMWNGSSWPTSQTRRLEASMEGVRYNFDAVWCDGAAGAVVAWGAAGTNRVRYLVWDGIAQVAGIPVRTGPDCQDRLRAIRLLPLSDGVRVMAICSNNSKDLRYSLWTGTAFRGDPALLLEPSMKTESGLPYAMAEPRGN